MARSKKNRVIALTKTKKTNLLDKKKQMVDKIHLLVEEYKYTYAFSYKNMTTLAMQSIRQYWKDSRFLLGKTKVMQVSLGRDDSDSFKPNFHLLSQLLKGNCGLFFSNEDPDKVIE